MLEKNRPHEYEKFVTSQFYGKGILCPRCKENKNEQPLHSVGDYENLIFCPHCDLKFELTLGELK